MTVTFGSVCSGIEAASVAWNPLGWRAAFLSEIEAFPRAVLTHHHPDVPLRGDFTTIQAGDHESIDVLVGGTPCPSFSVAGLRGGLADERGNLALEYLRLADRLRPRWLLWENVPGVLSSSDGRDFGAFVGNLVQLGYGFAYRVLDAQYFGLAQRRKRVFVVGCFGDWRRAAAVLFEPESLRGNPSPRREARQDVASCLTGGADAGSGCSRYDAETETLIAPSLTSNPYGDHAGREGLLVAGTLSANGDASSGFRDCDGLITHSLRADGFDASEDGTGRGTPLLPISFRHNASFAEHGFNVCGTLQAENLHAVAHTTNVRRLTPNECETLQGFPSGHTYVPYRNGMAADGPRYKALGNSMAVPVISWIGSRIATQMEAA